MILLLISAADVLHHPHSFPTRRSSDLTRQRAPPVGLSAHGHGIGSLATAATHQRHATITAIVDTVGDVPHAFETGMRRQNYSGQITNKTLALLYSLQQTCKTDSALVTR